MTKPTHEGGERLSVELETKLLHRLAAEWDNVNVTYFKGVLRRPQLGLSQTRMRLGQWQRSLRTLEVSRTLVLERPWGEVVEVLKHEVAHQFVDECLAVDEPPHGPTFRSVCARLGIAGAAHMRLDDAAEPDEPSEADRVVARIRKLLALAGSPNQHEAENAASLAQKLMLRFNVELEAVQTPADFGFHHLGTPSGRIFEYHRRVAVILGEHFFVEAIWVPAYRPRDGKRGSVLEICGSRPNLTMAAYVHDFLHATAERLWKDYRRAKQIRSNRDRRTFLAGVMEGFESKLDAQRSQFQQEGLVWVPLAELGRYFRRRHPYVRSVRGSGTRVNDAYTEGQRAGGEIVLSRPVEDGPSGRAPRALGPDRGP